MSETVRNPYICVFINEDQIQGIKDQILKSLKELFEEKISIQELPTPHITISYTMGKATKESLENFAKEITEAPFKIRIIGIRTILSIYYNGTILALILENSDDYLYSRSFLQETSQEEGNDFIVKKQKDKNGFEAHISMFVIPNMMGKTEYILPKYLENLLGGVGKDIFASTLDICDDNREKILEYKFPSN